MPIETLRDLVRGLNREQRQAVTHRAGPLLVVAGPGTGKTEVVTRRVAWLIAAKLARPREILALTFTDNAASEMQARVDMLVPYGQADAAIHTFHAFGDRLLRQHAFELGLGGDVRLITRTEAIVLLREHLFELGLERYLPLGDPTRFLGALVDLFARAKDEDVTPDAFAAHAQRLLALATDAAGQLDPAPADHATAQAEIARAYGRYCELLARAGLIDHADQVGLPLRLLRDRPAIRQAVVDRYRYLLVDELQDTNRSQLELVLALAGVNRNVMVVGDPDQGIYAFRGAATGNVARFETAFAGARRIVLRRNYRSRAPILEASAQLVKHASPSIEPRQQVAHRRGRTAQPVRCTVHATPEAEADAVADQIARRIQGGERPSDFAVLVRSNGETDPIMRSLLARGVPAHNGARPNLFELPAVRALLAFLRVVANPDDSLELYVLATAAPYGLGAAELNPLLQGARRRHSSLWQVLQEVVAGGARPARPGARTRQARLVEHVRAALELAADRSSGEVLYDYLRRSGLLSRLATSDPNMADLAGLHGIARFFQIVRKRASLLAHDRVALLAPHLADVAGLGDLDDDESSSERVSVLTVHRAKGLEFKVVYLCGLVDGRFPVRGRPPLLALPPELSAEAATGDDDLAEERRLFYVAMTRARDELWLSHHRTGPDGRSRRRPSPFLAEALDIAHVPVDEGLGGRASVARIEPARPTPAVRPPTAQSTGGSLSLSYSQVDDYLSCPQRYRLRYVVGLPTPEHHALSYGSALHQAVAAFHLRQGQGQTMAEPELLAEFARAWRPDGFLSREHEDARFRAGQATLRQFRQRELESGTTPVAIERPFRFRLGHDQVVGRIDRLDRTGEGTVITDYKSSDVRDAKRADARARDSLQLQVYALAHQAETGELPAAVQLHFLDGDTVGRAVPQPERLAKALQTLTGVAEGVRAGQFDARPGARTCGYCPFRQVCPSSAA